MATSILHRATGIALFVGSFLLVGWFIALAMGPEAYGAYSGLIGSIIGQILLFGFTLAIFYHLANGIRHLVWDAGAGYAPSTASFTAWLVIGFAVIASIALWAVILA